MRAASSLATSELPLQKSTDRRADASRCQTERSCVVQGPAGNFLLVIEDKCRILPHLEVLNMKWTRITDASVPQLMKLKSLRDFNPIETRLTRDGEAALRRANPQLSIAIDAPP